MYKHSYNHNKSSRHRGLEIKMNRQINQAYAGKTKNFMTCSYYLSNNYELTVQKRTNLRLNETIKSSNGLNAADF